MEEQDQIYARRQAAVADFRFDEQVARVFPDMIGRSVPGYRQLLPMIALKARRYAQPGSRLYDLGCSLGGVALAMRRAVQAEAVEIIAVDTSEAMVARCRQAVAEDNSRVPVQVIKADIREQPVSDASVIVLNFTLQFLPPGDRGPLLRRLYEGLRPGGVLILAEKLRFDDPAEAELLQAWHEDYKRAQGYSDLEIAQKRQALEKVMLTDSREIHLQRVAEAGFGRCVQWFQNYQFCAFLAVK